MAGMAELFQKKIQEAEILKFSIELNECKTLEDFLELQKKYNVLAEELRKSQ